MKRGEMSKGIPDDTTVDPDFAFSSSTWMRLLQGGKGYTTFYIKTHIIETMNAFRFFSVYLFNSYTLKSERFVELNEWSVLFTYRHLLYLFCFQVHIKT